MKVVLVSRKASIYAGWSGVGDDDDDEDGGNATASSQVIARGAQPVYANVYLSLSLGSHARRASGTVQGVQHSSIPIVVVVGVLQCSWRNRWPYSVRLHHSPSPKIWVLFALRRDLQ